MLAIRTLVAAVLVTTGIYYDQVNVKVKEWSQYMQDTFDTYNVTLIRFPDDVSVPPPVSCIPEEPVPVVKPQELQIDVRMETKPETPEHESQSEQESQSYWLWLESSSVWWFIIKEASVMVLGWLFLVFYSRKKIVVYKATSDGLRAQLKMAAAQKDELQSTVAALEAERTVLQEKLAKAKAIARRMTVEERNNYPVPDHLFEHLRKINVCVTGTTGGGKSSFVNALLKSQNVDDMEPTADAAAPVGWIETTKMPLSFVHPEFPDVVLWDCPGVGTRNFPADAYVRTMGLKHFACVVIVSSTRFTENDHLLRAELDRVRLPYFCVRSKFDQDRDSLLKHMNRNLQRANSLDALPMGMESVRFKEMKEDLKREQGIRVPYVLSAFEKGAYDFPKFLKHFHTLLTQFSNERSPMLSCEVCSNEEDAVSRPLQSCYYCRYFVCVPCADVMPACESCPHCHRPAKYKELGAVVPADPATSESEHRIRHYQQSLKLMSGRQKTATLLLMRALKILQSKVMTRRTALLWVIMILMSMRLKRKFF